MKIPSIKIVNYNRGAYKIFLDDKLVCQDFGGDRGFPKPDLFWLKILDIPFEEIYE